jgi:hypothetical protein
MRTGTRHGFLLLLTLLFASMAMFGGVVSAGMMTMDGKMSDCPYMGTYGYCDMSITEHLDDWQTLFAATLDDFHASDLFLLLTFALLAAFHTLFVPKRIQRPILKRWQTLELFDPLRLAFARGIIHPKLFS